MYFQYSLLWLPFENNELVIDEQKSVLKVVGLFDVLVNIYLQYLELNLNLYARFKVLPVQVCFILWYFSTS